MTGDEIGRVQAHLDCLDDEFSSRLREGVRAETSVKPNTLISAGLGPLS